MSETENLKDLAELERQYVAMYDVVQQYQQAFGWLHQQEWFQNNEHLLRRYLGQQQVDMLTLVDVKKSQFSKLQPKKFSCHVCSQIIIRENPQKNTKYLCFDCKKERHFLATKKQKERNRAI